MGKRRPIKAVSDAWTYKTPRIFWLPICGLAVGAFFIAVCVIPAYFAGYQASVNRTNNQDAIGGWVNTGGYEDWAVVPLQDTLEVMYVESQTGLRPPASNLTQLQNFMLINVRYLPTNLRDGIINTIDLAVELEAYGNYSSLYSQGSKYDVLLLPPSLPNVSNPTLRMDIDVSPPTYFERQSTSLPAAVVTKPSVTVVKGPSYYPFDKYNASITVSLAYANGTRGNALRSLDYPPPKWGLLFWPSAELVDISATVQESQDDESFIIDEQGRVLAFVVAVVNLQIQRSALVKTLVIFMGILTWLLCSFLFAISVDYLFVRSREALPPMIGSTFALLFALPNLRNALPSVPPIGIAYDVWVFIPSLMVTCTAALFIMSAHFGFSGSSRAKRFRRPVKPVEGLPTGNGRT